jgi:hypothetical protein
VLASEALPPDPPHPAARNMTAPTTTAVALLEPVARLVKRLVRAPIANTILLGDFVLSTCEPGEGYCRSGVSATVKTRWSPGDALSGRCGPLGATMFIPPSLHVHMNVCASSRPPTDGTLEHAERAALRRPGARGSAGRRSTRANFGSLCRQPARANTFAEETVNVASSQHDTCP